MFVQCFMSMIRLIAAEFWPRGTVRPVRPVRPPLNLTFRPHLAQFERDFFWPTRWVLRARLNARWRCTVPFVSRASLLVWGVVIQPWSREIHFLLYWIFESGFTLCYHSFILYLFFALSSGACSPTSDPAQVILCLYCSVFQVPR